MHSVVLSIFRTDGSLRRTCSSLKSIRILMLGRSSIHSPGQSTPDFDSVSRSKKLSKAMKAYLERASAHDEFMKVQLHEYEVGRRHLANIMGEDPETFSQQDIDRAVEYLMPSGLHDPKARPLFKHPEQIFPKRKAAEFDDSGRPHHFLFYTGKPNFYEILYQITEKILKLNVHEDKKIAAGVFKPELSEKINLGGTQWLNKEEFQQLIIEKTQDRDYELFLMSMKRLVDHPYSDKEKEFIFKFCKKLVAVTQAMEIIPLKYDKDGVAYVEATGRRKHCLANVTVRDQGTGKMIINGQDLSYFDSIQEREQIMFPLHFCGKLHKVDVKAEVTGVGTSAQAGAVRHALALALRSFISPDEVEQMRLAGLLTQDLRIKERKKPGQEGARRKYTWKKR